MPGSQGIQSVSALADGGFVVTWSSAHGNSAEIKAQVFDRAGAKVGTEFMVNTHTAAPQITSAVAALSDEGFVIAWADQSGTLGDARGRSIKAQAYALQQSVGTTADDSFAAALGSSAIEADNGNDTVVFGFALTDATVSFRGNKVIFDTHASHTVVSGAERFVFTDGTIENNDGNRLVDDLFYYSRHHDVWNAGTDADTHFATLGWKEGRDPNAFSTPRSILRSTTT